MPTVMLPEDLYVALSRKVAARKRTVDEEVEAVLREQSEVVSDWPNPQPRQPGEFFMTDEAIAPIDLPRPDTAVKVAAKEGGARRPDLSWLREDGETP